MTAAAIDDPWQIPAANEPSEQPAKPLAGLDLNRLTAEPVEPDWLVKQRLARQWLCLIGAKPGTGKTWIADALSLSVATGTPWLGHDVPKPARVLYIDAENGDDLALERLRQLGATPDALGGRLRYVTESIALPSTRDVDRLRATLDEHRPDLVIIDTLASVAPSAERDTESAAAFYTAVWHLIRDRGAALVLLVHLRKSLQGASRDDPLDAFRGAGHLVGAAHRAWTLEPVAIDKPIFLLHDVKARRGKKLPTVRVEVIDEPDSDPVRTRVELVGTVDDVESGYDAFVGQILTFIDNAVTGQAKTADLLLLPDAPGSRRTAGDYLTRATAAGILRKPKKGIYTRGGAQLPINTNPEDET